MRNWILQMSQNAIEAFIVTVQTEGQEALQENRSE